MQKEIRLFDYVKALWKHKATIAAAVFVVTSATIIYSYFMPLQYQAEAVIMPIASPVSGGASLGNFFASIPLLGGKGDDTTTSFLIYLNSKALRIQVVKGLNLLPEFFPDEENAVSKLNEEQKLSMAADRVGGMITVFNDRLQRQKIFISAVSENPEFSAKLVRQYLVELQNFISNNALTRVKQQQLFLEKQLAKNKKDILEMGKTLSRFYVQNPVSSVKPNLRVPVAVYTKEGARDFKNYEEFKAHFDLLQKKELPSLEREIEYVSDVPHQVYIKYITVQQSILENNYGLLFQSYEAAKIEANKQEPSFQILDEPVVPMHRFSPNRREMAKMAFGISMLLGFAWAFYREFYAPQLRLKRVSTDYEEEKGLVEEVA